MKFPYVSAIIIGAALAISGCASNDPGSTKAVATTPSAPKSVVAASASPAPKATPAAATTAVTSNERMSLSVGDEFVIGRYDSLSAALAGRNKKGTETITVTNIATDGTTTMSNDTVYNAAGNTVQRRDERRGITKMTPSQMILPEGDIKAGMSWPVKYTETFSDGTTRTFEGTATVLGNKTVTVPAGTFQAWNITHKGTWEMGNQSGNFNMETYVAPYLDNRNIAGTFTWYTARASGTSAYALERATLARQSVAETPTKN